MAIEALVCDASGTLLTTGLDPQPGVASMLARLIALGVRVVVAANHPESQTRQQLSSAGLLEYVDHIVAREHVTRDKGSPVWVTKFRELTGLEANQLFYLGNSSGPLQRRRTKTCRRASRSTRCPDSLRLSSVVRFIY
jgi:phosphoglycolate phosphatase-like HAD superfamily hydrolase